MTPSLDVPEVSKAAMRHFPDRFAATLRPDEHAVRVLDQADCMAQEHCAALTTLRFSLPLYCPELNPVERA